MVRVVAVVPVLIVWSAVDECAAYLVIRYEVTVEPSDVGLAHAIAADEAESR